MHAVINNMVTSLANKITNHSTPTSNNNTLISPHRSSTTSLSKRTDGMTNHTVVMIDRTKVAHHNHTRTIGTNIIFRQKTTNRPYCVAPRL
jgi:hypothetical protein